MSLCPCNVGESELVEDLRLELKKIQKGDMSKNMPKNFNHVFVFSLYRKIGVFIFTRKVILKDMLQTEVGQTS